ncbi:glycoside hydrolase family 25 protein [Streptomyces sp. NPDC051016]|uniref:glycoside hydrolase family 25 protein n=1 Tax=Streptomyces sp. NPDC051016 TaxID=3365638 RepID=UPI0037AB879C
MATCRGLDVSVYQATQDWTTWKTKGAVFAFAKASEGQTSRDSRFTTHITGIKTAGLIPGAYHFAWPNQDPAREAANYIAAVKPYAGAGFCHWLDLERYSDGRNYRGRTAKQINEWVTTWLAAVRTAFPGQRVGVYTSADDIAAGHVPAGVPLWYPAYPGSAVDTYPEAEARAQPKPAGRAPMIWQFTSTPASGPRTDLNICYLSAADLRAWAAGTEEDDVALTTDEINKIAEASAKKVLTLDAIAAPADAPDIKTNATWQLQSYIKDIDARVRAIQAQEAGQSAAIAALAKLVGSGVDTAQVVATVQTAIADAVVHVSVDVTGPSAT